MSILMCLPVQDSVCLCTADWKTRRCPTATRHLVAVGLPFITMRSIVVCRRLHAHYFQVLELECLRCDSASQTSELPVLQHKMSLVGGGVVLETPGAQSCVAQKKHVTGDPVCLRSDFITNSLSVGRSVGRSVPRSLSRSSSPLPLLSLYFYVSRHRTAVAWYENPKFLDEQPKKPQVMAVKSCASKWSRAWKAA